MPGSCINNTELESIERGLNDLNRKVSDAWGGKDSSDNAPMEQSTSANDADTLDPSKTLTGKVKGSKKKNSQDIRDGQIHPGNEILLDEKTHNEPLFELSEEGIRNEKDGIIWSALETICETLCCQNASVFLFSKDGLLERVSTYTYGDKNRSSHDRNWLPAESYEIDNELLVSKAAIPPNQERYGKFQVHNKLENDVNASNLFNEHFKSEYEKKDKIRCVVAMPLNGPSRTYGVLRVINKLDKDSQFLEVETYKLLSFSIALSNGLSRFRATLNTRIYETLTGFLIQMSQIPAYYEGVGEEDEILRQKQCKVKEAFQKTLSLLIKNSDTAFTAGAVYVEKAGKFEEFVKLGNVVQDYKILSVVHESQERKIVPKNGESSSYFPLVFKDECLGVLLLQVGYRYTFHNEVCEFVKGISGILAAILKDVRLSQQQQKTQGAEARKSKTSLTSAYKVILQEDSDSERRSNAAIVLGEIGGINVVPALNKALMEDLDANVRSEVIKSLTMIACKDDRVGQNNKYSIVAKPGFQDDELTRSIMKVIEEIQAMLKKDKKQPRKSEISPIIARLLKENPTLKQQFYRLLQGEMNVRILKSLLPSSWGKSLIETIQREVT
jgi:hypothetical protein